MQKLRGSWEEKREEIFNHLSFYRFHLTIATIAMKNFGVKRKFIVWHACHFCVPSAIVLKRSFPFFFFAQKTIRETLLPTELLSDDYNRQLLLKVFFISSFAKTVFSVPFPCFFFINTVLIEQFYFNNLAEKGNSTITASILQ